MSAESDCQFYPSLFTLLFYNILHQLTVKIKAKDGVSVIGDQSNSMDLNLQCLKAFLSELINLKNPFENLKLKVKIKNKRFKKVNKQFKIKNTSLKKMCNLLTTQLAKAEKLF